MKWLQFLKSILGEQKYTPFFSPRELQAAERNVKTCIALIVQCQIDVENQNKTQVKIPFGFSSPSEHKLKL